jgi:hypothetical protein
MKKFVEASFKVDVAGLPPIFMDAKSSVEIRKKLRRQLKFPDDIENIERITKGEKIKSFKDRLKSTLSAKGQDVQEAKASEDMLLNPSKMAKKSTFLSPQNTDKLKTDLATLKKKLGPNHPLNKPKAEACWSGYKQVGMKKKGSRQVPNCVPEAKVHELVQLAPAAMAVGAAAVRAAPAAGAALHTVQKVAKKAYKKFTGKEETDLEEKKKKLTRAQRNKKMRAADRAKERRIRKGNPFNVQT